MSVFPENLSYQDQLAKFWGQDVSQLTPKQKAILIGLLKELNKRKQQNQNPGQEPSL